MGKEPSEEKSSQQEEKEISLKFLKRNMDLRNKMNQAKSQGCEPEENTEKHHGTKRARENLSRRPTSSQEEFQQNITA